MALSTNLVAVYKLDNVNDSLNGFNLTNTNSVAFSAGLIGNAADFGTTNSTKYLSVANNLGVTSSTACSFEVWVKIGTSGNNEFIWHGDSVDKRSYDIIANATQVYFRTNIRGTGFQNIVSNTTLSTSNWYQFVFTFNGTQSEGFINGTSVGTIASSGVGSLATSDIFYIGKEDGAATYATGLVDEVRVWSRAITSTEVTELYNGGAGLQYPFTVAGSDPLFMGMAF